MLGVPKSVIWRFPRMFNIHWCKFSSFPLILIFLIHSVELIELHIVAKICSGSWLAGVFYFEVVFMYWCLCTQLQCCHYFARFFTFCPMLGAVLKREYHVLSTLYFKREYHVLSLADSCELAMWFGWYNLTLANGAYNGLTWPRQDS